MWITYLLLRTTKAKNITIFLWITVFACGKPPKNSEKRAKNSGFIHKQTFFSTEQKVIHIQKGRYTLWNKCIITQKLCIKRQSDCGYAKGDLSNVSKIYLYVEKGVIECGCFACRGKGVFLFLE